MRIVSLPLASRPLLIGGKNRLDLDEENPAPSLLAKKSAQTPAANTPPPAAAPPAARPSAVTPPSPVAQPSAAQTSAAAAQLATVPTWLKGQPAQPPASSGAASAPLIPLRPAAPANNAAPKPAAIPLQPAAASAAKTAQQPQPPGAPAPGQQPASSAQTPAPGPQAAAAPRSAATPPASTPATGQQPSATQPPAPAAVPPPNSTPPLPAPIAPAGRAAAAPPQPQPRGISSNPRGDGAAAVRMQGDIAAGKVIQDGKVVPHPDKSGDLYHAGFTQPTFTDDAKKGTTIPYRDDHGKVHPIGVQDMRRTTDPAGNASYSFQLNGQNISVPEDSKAPLFQIDPQTGRRFTTAADGTRRELGYDRNTAAQAGVAPREQARDDAREKLLTQGAALTRQLQDKQAQVAAAQQRMDAAQQKYHNPGNATDAERQASVNEVMDAVAAHTRLTSEVQTLQKQHDEHYQNLINNQRARQAEINQHKSAAAESPDDAQWQKDSRHTQGDTREADATLIAEAEKKGPEAAAAMRSALTPQPTQRTLAAAQAAFGSGNGGGSTATGQPAAAPGKTMTLHDMLMHAPEMKQGGWKTVDQAAAARATAQATFGITDPENVHVTPGASGGYSLSRKGADGSPGQPFATMDGQTGRITLLPGADGRYSPAAQDLAARSTPGSAPVYLGKGTPLTEAERSDLIKKGQQATAAAKDRQSADAALTAAGLSPEGIQKLRNEGRLSVQDAKFFNDKFNSGYSSYAQRDAHETAQKQNAGLLQMYRDTKAPADKPNFKSWMEKGDPQRDAMVQAKAKELGMSEDHVRRAMEDQRRTDFATPVTQQGHDQQSGMVNAFRRGIGFSGHDQDTTRTLTDGSLAVNPSLTDDKEKFEKAIQDSSASPEAKAAALKTWPAQHDAWLTRATDTLKAGKTLPGVEDYNAWLTKNTLAGHFSQKLPDGSVRPYTDNEKTQLYLDAMKNRSGVRKFMDNVSTSLVAGGGQVVSGLLGAAALAGNTFQDITGVNVGGEAASEAAAGMAAQNQGLTSAHELTGTVEGTGSRFISNLIQAVPSVGAAIASGGTAGLILGAAQSAGGTYTDLLQNHIMAGDSIEAAHKKAAGTAIASGAVGLALSKLMPGGAQALNNPATKKAFSSAVKSFAKGGAEEISQGAIEEGFTHIASEMNKGKTFNEAATSFAEQFPQNALTSALLGGGVQTMADKKNASAQPQPATNQPAPPPGHVAPSTQPDGKQSFSTVDAEGREIPPSDTPELATIAPAVVPRQPTTAEPAPGPSIPQSTTQSITASGPEAPTTAPGVQPPQKPDTAPPAQAGIPDNATPIPAAAPAGMEPSKEAAAAGQVMTLETAPQVLGDIERLKAKEKNGGLTKDEQISLHNAETLLARAQVTNLETKQKALSKLPTPRDLHSTELDALAKAKAMLARPWPGTGPASTTQSSSGSLPPGDTSTTHGVTPPAAIATSGHTGTGESPGTAATGSTTSTASSGGTTAPSTGRGSGTHTTNGVTAPPVGHGNLIPEDTTHAEHIDLANRRTENLDKIARKRPLNPHEQEVYDNARRVRDRNSPAQPDDRNSPATPGSRTTSDPKDLVMAGDDGPAPPPQSAAADAPTPTAAVEPTNAVGSTINESGATNQGTPTASIAVPTPPPPTGASPSISVAPAGSATSPPLGGPPGAVTGTSTSISASPPSGSSPPPSTISGNPATTSGSPATSPAKSPLPQFASLTPIPFPENSPEARIERQKRAPVRKIILDHDGIKPADKAKVLGIEKGKRPDPKTYMSDAFIKAHREEFIDGASRIIPTRNLNKYGPAQADGTSFVFPTHQMSDILKEAGGDRGKLEDLLGIPRGQLGSRPLSRVDFKNPASLNIRIPSGNEAGANDQWLPGARLPTGKLEGVIDAGNGPRDMWTHEDLYIK